MKKKTGKVSPVFSSSVKRSKVKKHYNLDGTPDRRFKENKFLKKDGTPDKRYFKKNKKEEEKKEELSGFLEIHDYSLLSILTDWIVNREFSFYVSFIEQIANADILQAIGMSSDLGADYYKMRRSKGDISPLIIYYLEWNANQKTIVLVWDKTSTPNEKIDLSYYFFKYF